MDIILRFLYKIIIEELPDSRAGLSILGYYSAVRGLSNPYGDRFLCPYAYTSTLAKLIYWARLIIMEIMLLCFIYLYI